MSATDPKPLDDGAYDVPRGAHVTHVANREHQIGADDPRRDRPLGTLRLESQIRDLGDHLFTDTSEHQQVNAIFYFGVRECPPECAQTAGRKRGTLDAPQERGAVARVEIGKRSHVVVARLSTEQLGVALDAVYESRREPGEKIETRCANVLGQDRRGGTLVGADISEYRVVARALRVVIDHHIHRAHPRWHVLAEYGGLDVQ